MVKSRTAVKDDLPKILEALRKAMDGQTHRLQGAGKVPGLFAGGKTAAPLANRALAEGLLQQAPPESGTGNGKAGGVYVCITDKGRQLVLDGGDTAKVLAALVPFPVDKVRAGSGSWR